MTLLLSRTGLSGLACSRHSSERRYNAFASPTERQCTPSHVNCAHVGGITGHGRLRHSITCARVAETQEAQTEESEPQIEGIDRAYCDEFECTSSPAVERNLRALARDITRVAGWTLSFFSKTVQYQDPFRKFEGRDKYSRKTFATQCLKDPKVLVTKMRMADRATGVVSWRLRATLGIFPVDIDFETEFTLDLITGSVLKHTEKWDLHRLSLPAKAAFQAVRAGWSAGQLAQDLSEGAKETPRPDQDDNQGVYRDPTDPTRFFQGGDDTMRDAYQIALVLALLWLVASVWWQLENIK